MSEINRVYYNKLVRDNVPAKIEAKHQQCDYRKITDVQELQQELFKKIKEEAASLSMSRSKEEFLEEYSDLMVVLETLIRQLEISKEELIEFRKDNLIKKGSYKHGYFLNWSADVEYRSNESVQGIPL
ncbi:nucleoside triphosphate pyrophosphohydrolase [Candidatus Kaiserbacteria bacterium]|nr:nucleoside triphosphate pyrophosphohydrolase [Candidatus Kaiserbacteria bacterium]NCT01662.1 nucleoside triphosphate pyrophosphohydrolase [Candidatus Parcubacteria bacterium]